MKKLNSNILLIFFFSVALIICFNLRNSYFNYDFILSGYLGIDLLFLLSGYYCSYFLKNFNSKNIYLLNKIFINFLLFLLIFILVGWFYLYPNSYYDSAFSILYALFVSMNIYFWKLGIILFSEKLNNYPLYFLWPISTIIRLVVLFWFFNFFLSKLNKNKHLYYFLTIFLIFFILALVSYNYKPIFSYYTIAGRGWQFGLGFLLVFINLKVLNKNVFTYISIITLFFILFYFDYKKYDNVLISALFLLSASILLIKKLSIFNISQKKKEFYFFLILNIFFFHFVLISLYEISIISNKNIVILIIIFLIFVIFFTRNFFLNLKIFQSLKFIYINLVLVFLSSLIIISNNGFKEVRLKAFKEYYGGIEIDNGFLRDQSWSLLANYDYKRFLGSNKIKVLIIGDSHSKDIFNVFHQNLDKFNADFARYGASSKRYDEFNSTHVNDQKSIIKFLNSNLFVKSDYILISEYNPSFKNLEKLIELLIKREKKIILITNAIHFETKGNKTLVDEIIINRILNKEKKYFNLNSLNEKFGNKMYKKSRIVNDKINLFVNFSKKKNGITIIDKYKYQCNKKISCDILTKEMKKIYYDGSHLTLDGAKYFGEIIANRELLKIF